MNAGILDGKISPDSNIRIGRAWGCVAYIGIIKPAAYLVTEIGVVVCLAAVTLETDAFTYLVLSFYWYVCETATLKARRWRSGWSGRGCQTQGRINFAASV